MIKIRKILTICFCAIWISQTAWADSYAVISHLSGKVKIRRGVEETWQPAAIGASLQEIDTILTAEGAWVVIKMNDGRNFRLGSNAILDIADLRDVTEKELFLYLMSKKIDQIEPRPEKTRIRIGNVSVIHGASRIESDNTFADNSSADWWLPEINGAKDLHNQYFYPNTIIKLHKIIEKSRSVDDCGQIHLYLGKSFEAMNQTGQAIDAYQEVITECEEKECDNAEAQRRVDQAREAIERLKH